METAKLPGTATAYRRMKQIEECLYENLLQRPYSSVSVSDLCHQLGISRKSFYNYFSDKDTCFRSVINRRLQACTLYLTRDLPMDASREEMVGAFLTFWKGERSLFDIIVRNNLLTALMDQWICFLREEDQSFLQLLSSPELKSDKYILAGFVSIHVTLLLQWYLEGYATPLEEMVRNYQRLVNQPLISREERTEEAH